ncbi:MAG: tetratricopeptide repeat protein [Syntrophobacteraceae bacterium]
MRKNVWKQFAGCLLPIILLAFLLPGFSYGTNQTAAGDPGEMQKAAEAHLAQAIKHESMGEYSLALESHQKYLDLCIGIFGTDHPDTAAAYSNLGRIHHLSGHYPEALENMNKALDIFARAGGQEQPEMAILYNNIAALYESMGNYGKALEYFDRSLSIRLKVFGSEHPSTATAYNNLASVYSSMGRPEIALENQQKALAVYLKVNGAEHASTAIAYNNIGSILKSMGRYAEALQNFRKDLEISLKVFGPEHPNTAVSYNNIASVYEMTGEFENALENFEKALSIFSSALGPNHPSTAKSYNNIGSVYLSLGEYSKALREYQKALAAAQSMGDAQLKWNVLAGMSTTLSGLGHPAAIFFGKEAVNAIQSMRALMTSLDKSLRKGFMEDKERVYRRLAALLVDAGRIPEAQQVLNLLKEEEFFEFVRGESGSATGEIAYSEVEQSWTEKFAQINDQIARRGMELGEIKQKAKKGDLSVEDKNRAYEILSELEVASRSFEAFLDKISAEQEKRIGEKAADLTGKEMRELKSLQSTLRYLGKGTVVVYYLVTDNKLIIILTTPETQLSREVELSSKSLNRMISDLRKDLLCPSRDPRPAARKLYEAVFAPIARDLEQAGARTLMLSLDGALRYVPFACLYDGTGYLVEKYTTVVFTPASRDKLRIPPTPDWKIAGFGVAGKVDQSFRPLPAVRYELKSIIRNDGGKEGVLPGIVKLDREFTAEAMREALLGDYPVIHIASHFVFNLTDKDSFLLLGDGSRLSLDQIKHKGFRFDEVDLLTLSACETALSAEGANGREVEGFGVLAQRSGAKGVVATLWPVADRSTGVLMKRMYEAHAKKSGINKADSLREAQLELLLGQEARPVPPEESTPEERGEGQQDNECARRSSPSFELSESAPYAHPYFWAPFILMGNYL